MKYKSGLAQLGFQGRDLRQRLHGHLLYFAAAALFKKAETEEASFTNCC